MSKKTIRLISTLLTILLLVTALTSTVFATATTKPGDFATGGSDISGTTLQTTGKNIIATIRTVAMIVAVIVLMILGIKYMVGSAEEKASYKKTMMPYLIGAILVFGAAAVSNLVYDFATGLGGTTA